MPSELGFSSKTPGCPTVRLWSCSSIPLVHFFGRAPKSPYGKATSSASSAGLACGVRVTPGRTGLRLPPPQPSSNSTSSNSFTYLLAYQRMAKLPHLLHLSVFDTRSLELQLPDTIGAGHRIPASRRRSRMKMDASAGSAEMLRAREICLGASTDKKGGRVDVRDTKGKL
ncbi:hypothetical protein BJX76DRAFT_343727 [Aspergillus varians]